MASVSMVNLFKYVKSIQTLSKFIGITFVKERIIPTSKHFYNRERDIQANIASHECLFMVHRRGYSSTSQGWRPGSDFMRRSEMLDKRSSSSRLGKDGSFYYICHPNKMQIDWNLKKNYKSSLKCIGGYSLNEKQNFCNNQRFLSLLNTDYLPKDNSKEMVVNFDLNTAQDSEEPYSGTCMKNSENFFLWIINNINSLSEIPRCNTNFVFLKNVFSELLVVPYFRHTDLNFYAIYLNGIIYLVNSERSKDQFPHLSTFGHKFKQYLTYGENVENGVISNHCYRCVMTAKLGSYNLLFSASMDCFNPDVCYSQSPDPTSSVLTKCCYVNPQNHTPVERYKMYDWCVGLASLNIPHLLVGFRNEDGIVKLLKLYTEDELCLHGKEYWDINVGFTFANNALSYIEETTKAKPGTVFNFTKCRSGPIYHIRAEEKEIKNFPPKWITEEIDEAISSHS